MSHITLPRAVVEEVTKTITAYLLAFERERPMFTPRFDAALAALAAALAEPEKERAEVAAPARSGVGAGQTNAPTGEAYRTPEPPAKREPATAEQVGEAYIAPDIEGRWADFEAGFRAAIAKAEEVKP